MYILKNIFSSGSIQQCDNLISIPRLGLIFMHKAPISSNVICMRPSSILIYLHACRIRVLASILIAKESILIFYGERQVKNYVTFMCRRAEFFRRRKLHLRSTRRCFHEGGLIFALVKTFLVKK